MLARWYDPAVGQFTSRDSVGLDPVPASVSANRFAYVNDSPLDDVNPTGHCGRWAVWCNVKAAGNAVVHNADQAWDWGTHQVEQAWDWGVNKFEDAWNWADQQVQHAYGEGKKIENQVVDTAKRAASTFIRTVHDAAHQVSQQAYELASKGVIAGDEPVLVHNWGGDVYDNGGSTRYGAFDSQDRPTKVSASITRTCPTPAPRPESRSSRPAGRATEQDSTKRADTCSRTAWVDQAASRTTWTLTQDR